MDPDLRDSIQRLHAVRLVQTEADAREFDQLLEQLAASDLDEEAIVELLKVFSDDCLMHEVMWGLVHFIEGKAGIDREVAALLVSLPGMSEGAGEWVRAPRHRDRPFYGNVNAQPLAA